MHGKFGRLRKIIQPGDVLAGDVGIGFSDTMIPPYKMPNISYIRGNHDNPEYVKIDPWKEVGWNYIKDGSVIDGVLYIGGAWSTDRYWRTPGLNWWPGEEISALEQQEILTNLINYTGRIHTVVSHDCPVYSYVGNNYKPTSTSEFLDELRRKVLLGNKKPEKWIHGHHHVPLRYSIDAVEFVSLGELEVYGLLPVV